MVTVLSVNITAKIIKKIITGKEVIDKEIIDNEVVETTFDLKLSGLLSYSYAKLIHINISKL